MKYFFALSLMICTLFSSHSQAYKVDDLLSISTTNTYFSYLKPLETSGTTAANDNIFVLWGNQRYGDSWADTSYEVQYFKGNPAETYQFLQNVIRFTEKYRNEDGIIGFYNGVKVKTFKVLGIKYTSIYDSENKVVTLVSEKQLNSMLAKLIEYCSANSIPLPR